jgi:hypothetical protein
MFGVKRWLLYEGQRGLRSRASALEFFNGLLPQLQQMPCTTAEEEAAAVADANSNHADYHKHQQPHYQRRQQLLQQHDQQQEQQQQQQQHRQCTTLQGQRVDEAAGVQDLGTPLELLTRSGDVVVVPKNWAHATLNLEAGIALAYEVRYDVADSKLQFI